MTPVRADLLTLDNGREIEDRERRVDRRGALSKKARERAALVAALSAFRATK